MLIIPDQLAAQLDDVVVLDARYYLGDAARGRADYEAGHIPGAVFVDVDADLAAQSGPGGVGGRHPLPAPEDFQATVRRWGIEAGTQVVVYDQSSSLAAARAWWMLTDAGLAVSVLDGGFRAWVAAGLPVTTEEPRPDAGDVVLRPGRLPVADAADVVQRGRGVRLIDVRAAERYRGDTEPIDRIPGRIPGAENLPAAMLQRPDGRFASASEVKAAFGDLSADDILSCGSGITATQAALAAAHAGLPLPRVYIGSYSDWISDPDRPIERG